MTEYSTWSRPHGCYLWACSTCGETGFDYESFAEAEAVRLAHAETHALRPAGAS